VNHRETGKNGVARAPEKQGVVRKALRWAALSIGGLLAVLILVVAVFVTFGVSIDLSALRGTVESAASEATGRPVRVDGAITLRPTLWPTIQIEGVRVGNPVGWPEEDFARVDHARAQLDVLAVLRGDVRIGEIDAEGIRLRMDVNAEGKPNWLFDTTEERREPEQREENQTQPLAFVELRSLSIRDIAVTYRDARGGEVFNATFDQVTGSAEYLEPMHLSISGSAQGVPYTVRLAGGNLDSFVDNKKPWPIELVTEVAGARFSLAGEARDPMRAAFVVLDFDFQGPKMKDLEALLGTELPPVRAFAFHGRMEESEGIFRISDLKGVVGQTEFSGSFEADATGTRPRLNGMLDIPSLDATPLLAALNELGERQPAAAPEPTEESQEDATPLHETVDLDEPVLVLDPLRNFDAEFALTIGEVANSPLGLRSASLQVLVVDGGLTAPMAVTLANVPFNGKISVTPEGETPKVDVSLWAENTDIGELALLLLSTEGVEGGFASAEMGFAAQGQTIRALGESAELRFSVADASLSYGNEANARPVAFTLENADMVMPTLDRSNFAAKGTLLGEPFALEAAAGTFIGSYIDRRWPVELTATGGGARLKLSGTVEEGRRGAGTNLSFDMRGERIGGLAPWIGLSPKARSGYALTGSVDITEKETRVRISEARIGNTALSGAVGLKKEAEGVISFFDLKASVIDPRELGSLAPAPEQQPRAQPTQQGPPAGSHGLAIDVPVMPQGIEIFDTDIDVAIQRIKLDPADVTGVALSTKIRDGHVESAPFRATIAGAVLAGDIAADLRGEDPAIDFSLRSENVNVGTLLAQLGVAEGLDLTAGRFALKLTMRGASTREILERSEFSAGIRNGLWKIKDPNMEGSVDIGLSTGTASAKRGKPITLSLDGRLDTTPVEITVSTDSLASFAKRKDRLQMNLGMAMLGTDLTLTGTAPLPVRADDLHFALDIRGRKFSDFDDLLDVSLPPIGPYRLTGEFGSRDSGYYLDNLEIAVRESKLTGELAFQSTANPPLLNAELVAKTIQLDDFRTGDWSPLAEGERPEKQPEPKKTSRTADQTVEEVRAALSPEVMRTIDATITLTVQEVLSGRDRLGGGSMIANLQDGRARVDPLTLDVPGGSVDVGFALEPTETDVGLEARAKIERLDYGILARRIDPASDVGGLISADVDFKTRGATLDNVMNSANGHIDFAVWPEDLNAELFDLWAVNLFAAMMPSLDSETHSKVNCLVARFTVRDGIMRPAAILIDSTNIQASGDGVIDFKADTVEFKAAPRPKRPRMFSAQTPVQVSGSIPEIEVGLASGALLGTIIRIVTSPIVVPFQWIFTEFEPPDGRAACQRAWGHAPPM